MDTGGNHVVAVPGSGGRGGGGGTLKTVSVGNSLTLSVIDGDVLCAGNDYPPAGPAAGADIYRSTPAPIGRPKTMQQPVSVVRPSVRRQGQLAVIIGSS